MMDAPDRTYPTYVDDVACRELAKGFSRSADWALVLHERQRRSPDEPCLARLRESNRTNQPEGPDDENFRLISSSGKLPHYLKFGSPSW